MGGARDEVRGQKGSIFYTSATGKVWGHDRGGNIIDGWPYRLTYRVPPVLRPDGRLMFILGGFEHGDGTTSDSEVIVLTTAGRISQGWPYRTSARLDGVQCDTDTFAYYPQAISTDGTLYLAPWTDDRAEVVALDGRGRVISGWPYGLPAGWSVIDLEMQPARGLAVTLQDCSGPNGCCATDAARRITLTPAGELAP